MGNAMIATLLNRQESPFENHVTTFYLKRARKDNSEMAIPARGNHCINTHPEWRPQNVDPWPLPYCPPPPPRQQQLPTWAPTTTQPLSLSSPPLVYTNTAYKLQFRQMHSTI